MLSRLGPLDQVHPGRPGEARGADEHHDLVIVDLTVTRRDGLRSGASFAVMIAMREADRECGVAMALLLARKGGPRMTQACHAVQ